MAAVLATTLLIPGRALAQTGVVSGTVFDTEDGAGLVSAVVQVVLPSGEEVDGVQAGPGGGFSFELEAGSYSLVVTLIGYETRRVDGVRVEAGATRDVPVALVSRALLLNPIVITASRREEKALDAPASISIVGSEAIGERAAATVIEHVKALPGVDIAQTGINQTNVVTRGFNNVFSGALLVLTDNRHAQVPSLRLNAYNMVPITNLDLERIEVVLGPGAALYGPNSASGVMHLITTSPIDVTGTSLSIAGGERSVFHGEFRHAARIGENAGIKFSGQYFRGDDFVFFDPVEVAARTAAIDAGDTDTRIGLRDFDNERWSANVRFDVRPWDDGELVFDVGTNMDVSSIELTGVGAGQADDWRYSSAQARLRKGRFFAQGFGNFSDAGDTFLLRTGTPIVDESRFWGLQAQHGAAVGERQDFTYGVDAQFTDPRTNGTITGRNEDDDDIKEYGAYLHSETALTDMLDAVVAVRIDDHSRLEDPVFSQRAALVLKPAENQNLRVTFNRAFSTPTTNNLFLDLVVGQIPIAPGVGYDLRALGTPESGLTFDDRCPGGFQDFCMRSPFVPGVQLPANAAIAWNTLVGAFAPPELAPLLLDDAPPVGTVLRRFNEEQLTFIDDPAGPREIARLEPAITQTIEVGYKGLIGDRLLLAADVYRSDITDFIGPLRTESPTVFLDPATTAAFIQERLTPLVGGPIKAEEFAGIVTQLTTGLAQVPIGTVGPDQSESSDIIFAYRNFGDFDLWGIDLAAQALVTDEVSISGTFSFVSEECFDFDSDGTCGSAVDVALNAPQTKGSLSLRYDNPRSGFSIEGRGRFSSSFAMNSGVYIGEVDSYAVLDTNLAYRFRRLPGTMISLTVSNLLDDDHLEFVGAPELGRVALVRLHYALP